jgi:hypothetical protein
MAKQTKGRRLVPCVSAFFSFLVRWLACNDSVLHKIHVSDWDMPCSILGLTLSVHRPSPTYIISSYAISELRSLKKVKTKNEITFMNWAEFSRAGRKAQWDEGGGRILLGDNIDGGEVMLLSIIFQYVGVWIATGLLCVFSGTYICSWLCVHSVSTCVGESVYRLLLRVP